MLLSLIHTVSCFFWGNAECASLPGTGFKEPVNLTLTTEFSSIKVYDSHSLGKQHQRNATVIPRSIFIPSRFGQTSTAKQAGTLHTRHEHPARDQLRERERWSTRAASAGAVRRAGCDKAILLGALQLSLPRTLQRVSNPTSRARKQNLGCQFWVLLAPSRDTNY